MMPALPALLSTGLLAIAGTPAAPPSAPAPAEMSGYMLVPVERAPEEFNAGF